MADYLSTYDGVAVPGIWNGSVGDFFQTSGALLIGGVCVDFPFEMAVDRDIVLDPPTFLSLDVVFTANSAMPWPVEYWVWVVNDPAPGLWSNGPPPPTNPPEYNPWDVLNDPDGAWLVETGTVAALAIGDELSVSVDMDDLFPMYRRSDWNGRINVILEAQRIGFPLTVLEWRSYLSATPTRLASVETGFITGLAGVDHRAHSRVGRCGKCGKLALRETFMQDGYSRGLWVCEDCWDPEDQPARPIPPDLPPIND